MTNLAYSAGRTGTTSAAAAAVASSARWQSALLGSALLLAGALVGAVTLDAAPLAILLAPAAALGLWLISRWPEYGILGVLLYTSTILSEEQLPPLNLGVGSLHISDLIILWLFAVLAFRIIVTRRLRFRRTDLDIPVALFIGVCVIATLKGISGGEIPADSGIRHLRATGYLVIYFLITNLIRDRAQLRRFWIGVMLLAVITAIAAILQTALGPGVPILPGRVETLNTQGLTHDEIARVIPPGESLIYLALILGVLSLATRRAMASTLRTWISTGLLGIGLILTFRRALWGSAALALLAALPLLPRAQRAQLLRAGAAAAAIVTLTVVGALTQAPDSELSRSLQATGERIGSMFDPDNYRRGDRDTQTLEQRVIELEYALPQVMPPSLLGHGLAAPYRPCLPLDAMDCSTPSYIHNGYVAILFNLGVVGFAAFIWILVGTAMGGLSARRVQLTSPARRLQHRSQQIAPSFDAETQRLAVACGFAFIGLVPALMLEPYMMLWHWTPVIALMIATVQLCKPTALAQPQVPKPQRLMPIMRANTEH